MSKVTQLQAGSQGATWLEGRENHMEDSNKQPEVVGSKAIQIGGLALLLFIFWLLLSGDFSVKFLTYGVLTCVISAYICYPILLIPNKAGTKQYFLFGVSPVKMLLYFFWLMRELVNANIDVVKASLSPELKIDPKVISFRYIIDNPVAMVVLANSITLTPGTVTLNMTEDGFYEIHALTEGAADGIFGGSMQEKVAWLFGAEYKLEFDEGAK